MKAIILAAGMASRLRPLTDHKPKCLLEIGKQCLLGRAIEGLIFNGIREVVIVTGYLQEQIIEFVQGHYPDLKVEYIYNEKYASTNNIYSLWLTKDKIRGERILLLDSEKPYWIVPTLLVWLSTTIRFLKKKSRLFLMPKVK